MNFIKLEAPNFAKREFEKLQEVISPFVKKASRYVFWSFPLIAVSIINVFVLLFGTGFDHSQISSLVIYAILGAIGMALSKEAKHQQVEIQRLSMDYIVNRIRNSDRVSDRVKEKYITLVKENPIEIMKYFLNFLEVENKANN
ncbi:hypothetical protein JOC85_002679 [Bacillus mesophilus]|uniref:DUF5392 family protein n=1 Tax=Bacillus mesophilus TaxID=1808955 RepID=UPI001957D2EF|nr:DUF5392 family protein [Bacillus mesophilus]MBM7661872.1 hypothetical protein [Bacillus mesophilus]